MPRKVELHWLRQLFGERSIEIEQDASERLALRYGSRRTVFDRTRGEVSQDGRLVAVLALVEQTEIHRPPSQEGAVNWFITVHVRGGRQVEVGQVSDETDASIIGARIATITDRPVSVRR